MRIRPFGLHKKTVKAFLKRIQQSHEQELAGMSIEIANAAQRRDELVLSLQAMNRERESASIAADLVADKLQASLVIDEEALQEQLAQELRNKQLKELEEQLFQELRNKLRKELESELRIELSAEIRSELRTELRGEAQEELRNELRGEVEKELRRELQEEAAADNSMDEPSIEQPTGSQLARTGKLLHFKQGGSKLRIVPKDPPAPLGEPDSIPAEPQPSQAAARMPASIPALPLKEQAKAVGMGFWGDVDEFLEPQRLEDPQLFIPEAYVQTHMAPSVKEPYFEPFSAALEELAAAVETPFAAPKQRVQTRLEPNIGQGEQPQPAKSKDGTAPAAPAAAQSSRPSPAISEEIRRIRQKYIAGKIAGEDVFDRRGRLIIAKQSLISENDVDKADAEGKLAELIIHMIIPGLGED